MEKREISVTTGNIFPGYKEILYSDHEIFLSVKLYQRSWMPPKIKDFIVSRRI